MSQIIVMRSISQTPKLGHRLIKFRYGPCNLQTQSLGDPQSSIIGASPSVGSKGKQLSQEPIWDFQIPARWRRAPISERECDAINSGGAF